MHGYYPFELQRFAGPRHRTLVLFSSACQPDSEEIAEQLESFCDERVPPDEIIVLSPKSEDSAVISAVKSDKFRDRVPAVTRFHDAPAVRIGFFDATGRIEAFEGREIEQDCGQAIRRAGMLNIFRSRDGLLSAPSTHHYVKPSGDHSRQFMRIGNVMVDGAEISFIAFCCLPRMPIKNLRHIYCDTGAITPVAMAVNTLRMRLSDEIGPATVGSFGSYDGLDRFHFSEVHKSIVLVSASTSGGLNDQLSRKHQIAGRRIVTLFFLSSKSPKGPVVCNLRRDEGKRIDGLNPIRSFPASSCPLCAEGSIQSRIVGDQFLPGEASTTAITLRASDSPDWLPNFLRQTVGKGFIRANYRHSQNLHAAKEVFFDLRGLFADPEMRGIAAYSDRFHWIVDQATPRALRRIIRLDDPASQELATAVARRAGLSDQTGIVTLSDVERDMDSFVSEDGATLVVASAVASGRSLLAAAQLLRYVQKNGAVNYIIGLMRMPSRDDSRDLRANVTYGQQPSDRGFFFVDQVHLPVYGPQKRTSWEDERDLISRLRDESEPDCRSFLTARDDVLRQSQGVLEGMLNDLFWESCSGERLRLRPGFVFFDFDHRGSTSQADVFFAMMSVLHELRRKSGKRSLQQHEHVRSLIAPRCFDRFNDGVIQASLLRAAWPVELNYSTSEKNSAEMSQVLDFVFSNSDLQPGEAAREFAVALALQRLRIRDVDLQQICSKQIRECPDPVVRKFLSHAYARLKASGEANEDSPPKTRQLDVDSLELSSAMDG